MGNASGNPSASSSESELKDEQVEKVNNEIVNYLLYKEEINPDTLRHAVRRSTSVEFSKQDFKDYVSKYEIDILLSLCVRHTALVRLRHVNLIGFHWKKYAKFIWILVVELPFSGRYWRLQDK
jgi:hypothetical protein